MRNTGRPVKRGLLFYGEPGTGKTYTAKWLAQTLEGVTVILLTGKNLWLIKQCCQLARIFEPSLVIVEDMKRLIARTEGASPAFIAELVRKATLFALEDNSLHEGTPKVTDRHFDLALREMLFGGGELTRRLFGSEVKSSSS